MRIDFQKFFSLSLLLIILLLGFRAQAGDTKAGVGNEIVPSGSGCTNNVVVTFPTAGPEQTRWDICFQTVSANVTDTLIIQDATFRKSPSSSPIEVLNDGRVSEIFVPYHPGSPRFHDVTDFDFSLLTLSSTDCPASAGGTLLANSKVCKEVRDRGVAWKDDSLVRRGEELVLWGVIDAANYNYIIEWTFLDDGTILGRAGSTGPKLSGPDDTTGHMHTFSWRLDFDLNGPAGDSVHRTSHSEPLPGEEATDGETLISTESGLKWNPRGFNTLEISDATLQNGNGRTTSYELIPLRFGTVRHNEAWTRKDFWVTLFDAAELNSRDLPTYLNGESVANANVVVWYTAGAHHENGMRDEDRDTVPVKWVGFELSPQNLFDDTPLFPLFP